MGISVRSICEDYIEISLDDRRFILSTSGGVREVLSVTGMYNNFLVAECRMSNGCKYVRYIDVSPIAHLLEGRSCAVS